ncbi:FAD binding domain-containing protein [Paenibacillus sp. HB172176]|uniref:FAD binding domain-containing protein n=1 Tax=Paenibacillus sp. HB172176 TaxID=2493690 RepID=UPI0014387655|nr:FAD binding domain-containing protein [Paenibacillus sp. HB172176]
MAMEQREDEKYPEVLLPDLIEEAWHLKRRYGPLAGYVSGGTLLRTLWENGVRPMTKIMISLEGIREMNGISIVDGKLSVGAATTLSDCRNNGILNAHVPLLRKALDGIAAPSVRNLATIGGNIASRIGDSLPALLALDAELIVYRDTSWHTIPLRDWLSQDEEGRKGDDLICRVLVPLQKLPDAERGGESFEYYEKLGRREAFAPSLVTVAARGSRDADGVISEIMLSAGGGSAMPERLTDAEAALRGSQLSSDMLGVVHGLIKRQYRAAEDLFADGEYRKEASANLITARLWKLLKGKG